MISIRQKQSILKTRELLEKINKDIANWHEKVEKDGNMKIAEVVAGNIECLRLITVLITSLDTRISNLENELLFGNKNYETNK